MNAAQDNPLNSFSGCHAGIITNFRQLANLPDLFLQAHKAEEIRKQADHFIHFFQNVVLKHHAEEEQELFEAVNQALGVDPAELELARRHVEQLKAEHRHLEQLWSMLEPDLKLLAKGKLATLDSEIIATLSGEYLSHALFEEETFLPLAERLLEGNGMAALGMSLHIRHMSFQPPAYI